jgi:hypothetical protein
MGSVNNPNPRLDTTVRVYDEFNQFESFVPVNEYDAVNSYFESVFREKTAAKSFTTGLFRVAQQTNVPIMTLLKDLQATGDLIQLTARLAFYLNIGRSRTTLLGVGGFTTPNLFQARNVIP